MKKSVLILFVIAVIFACLSGCRKGPQKYTDYSFDCFDTATVITGYAESKEEFDAVAADIKAQLYQYHRLYTIYNSYDGLNNLYSVNTADEPVKVDKKIIDLLLYAKEAYVLTDGKMNVAMGSVLSIWHDYRERGSDAPVSAELPPMEKLLAAVEHTDIDDLIIDEENSTVYLADPDMSLDVGAIGKGYAVEMVARALEEQGISGYVLNVGGNVRAVGLKSDGSPWAVGVENPQNEEDVPYIAYLNLTGGETLVTSGCYQRYYYVDGKSYHHIIDPETLMPGENYLSVSVLCKDSGLGDALSTALFSMKYEAGKALVESLSEVEAMWVLPDGEQKYSSGFEGHTFEYEE